jgi:hypothetical protein
VELKGVIALIGLVQVHRLHSDPSAAATPVANRPGNRPVPHHGQVSHPPDRLSVDITRIIACSDKGTGSAVSGRQNGFSPKVQHSLDRRQMKAGGLDRLNSN